LIRRRIVLGWPLALALPAGLPQAAGAEEFPIAHKPIRILVGFPPGGGTDLQARTVAQHLAQVLGVPVIVDNRPGAGTMIAAMEMVKAVPDGHTLLYTPSTTLAQLPHTLASVRYDTFKDFTPLSLGALGPLVLVVHRSVPATSVQELVAYAKTAPGRLNYVSQGIGTSAHIYGEMFARETGIDIVHVPYKGANDVAKDFLAGTVQLQFASSSAAAALQRSGKVRLLAVAAPERSALFPDVPTLAEQGVPGMDIESWIGFFGPAGMPASTVGRLNAALVQVLDLPEVQAEFRSGGVQPQSSTPEAFAAMVRQSYERWGEVIGKIGFKKE
jgi:tripartite-type tricarboxylate transporter receptor subunit TctC